MNESACFLLNMSSFSSVAIFLCKISINIFIYCYMTIYSNTRYFVKCLESKVVSLTLYYSFYFLMIILVFSCFMTHEVFHAKKEICTLRQIYLKAVQYSFEIFSIQLFENMYFSSEKKTVAFYD